MVAATDDRRRRRRPAWHSGKSSRPAAPLASAAWPQQFSLLALLHHYSLRRALHDASARGAVMLGPRATAALKATGEGIFGLHRAARHAERSSSLLLGGGRALRAREEAFSQCLSALSVGMISARRWTHAAATTSDGPSRDSGAVTKRTSSGSKMAKKSGRGADLDNGWVRLRCELADSACKKVHFLGGDTGRCASVAGFSGASNLVQLCAMRHLLHSRVRANSPKWSFSGAVLFLAWSAVSPGAPPPCRPAGPAGATLSFR